MRTRSAWTALGSPALGPLSLGPSLFEPSIARTPYRSDPVAVSRPVRVSVQRARLGSRVQAGSRDRLYQPDMLPDMPYQVHIRLIYRPDMSY